MNGQRSINGSVERIFHTGGDRANNTNDVFGVRMGSCTLLQRQKTVLKNKG